MKFVQYEHHGKQMWVREDLKGRHREHCLCFNCQHFRFNDRESNCPIANALYRFDILADVTTPVWECKKYEKCPLTLEAEENEHSHINT